MTTDLLYDALLAARDGNPIEPWERHHLDEAATRLTAIATHFAIDLADPATLRPVVFGALAGSAVVAATIRDDDLPRPLHAIVHLEMCGRVMSTLADRVAELEETAP